MWDADIQAKLLLVVVKWSSFHSLAWPSYAEPPPRPHFQTPSAVCAYSLLFLSCFRVKSYSYWACWVWMTSRKIGLFHSSCGVLIGLVANKHCTGLHWMFEVVHCVRVCRLQYGAINGICAEHAGHTGLALNNVGGRRRVKCPPANKAACWWYIVIESTSCNKAQCGHGRV